MDLAAARGLQFAMAMLYASLLLTTIAAGAIDRPADACAVAVERPAFVLNEATFDFWRSEILPTPVEIAWQQIPWRSNLRDGLVEADRTNKPVLLWLMNGHPRGCT